MARGCPFCSSAIRNRIIFENKYFKIFPSNTPIVLGHLLVVPVRHIATFGELTTKEVAVLQKTVLSCQNALVLAYGAQGFNSAWNEGEVAGQSVPHFHLHVVPRKKGDAGILKYEPRKFLYRPGSRRTTPDNELREIADKIRGAL
jgi:histidine triad (HIT) family protein